MNRLLEAAHEVCNFMTGRNWDYCVIGGLAVQQWGEPRTTLDADFTLLTGWGKEEPYVQELLDSFQARISDALDFALSRRILLMKASNGIEIDIALGALPFEEAMVERARPIEFAPGITLPCCTPEDLLIMKAFAGRPRDWQDARSIALRREALDADYIVHHLDELCSLRDDPDTVERVKALLKETQ